MSVGSITNQYSDIPGADALGLSGDPKLASNATAASSHSSVAGFDALGIQGNGQATPPVSTASVTAATGATGENVYQTAYDNIIAASDAALQQSTISGPPQIPIYAAGSSASQFAQLQTTLGAISTGLQNGLFDGTGVNQLA